MANIKLTLEIDEKKLHNVLLSAGGWCHYWCNTDRYLTGALDSGVRVFLHDDCIEADNIREHTLTRKKLIDGLRICARDKPFIFGKFLESHCDGPQADVIVQLALFGKVRFG